MQPLHRSFLSASAAAILISWTPVTLAAQQSAAHSEIRGTVRVRGGKPVPYAFVTAKPTDQTLPQEERPIITVQADDKGQYVIPSVHGGTYQFCVLAPPELEVLDPCEWSDTPPSADIPPGVVAQGIDLDLSKGKTLRIRMDDPDGALPTPAAPRPDRFLHFGVVAANGSIHKARLVSTDWKGHNYRLVVPANADFDFFADSINLTVDDDRGARLTKQAKSKHVKTDDQTVASEFKFTVRAGRK